MPTSEKYATCLYRHLWQERLRWEVHAGKKLHVTEDPGTDALHLFAGVSEDAVRHDDRHDSCPRFEEFPTRFDEQNFWGHLLEQLALLPASSDSRPLMTQVESLEDI